MEVGAVANLLPDLIEVLKVALAYIFSIHRNQYDSLRLLLEKVEDNSIVALPSVLRIEQSDLLLLYQGNQMLIFSMFWTGKPENEMIKSMIKM